MIIDHVLAAEPVCSECESTSCATLQQSTVLGVFQTMVEKESERTARRRRLRAKDRTQWMNSDKDRMQRMGVTSEPANTSKVSSNIGGK